jgi:hypothetical protein
MTGVRLADRLGGSVALPDDVVDKRDAEEGGKARAGLLLHSGSQRGAVRMA